MFGTDINCTVTCNGYSSLPENEPSGSETCTGRRYCQKFNRSACCRSKLFDCSLVEVKQSRYRPGQAQRVPGS